MNDDDRKMIEEAEGLYFEAPTRLWIENIARARELLPALTKRLREVLDHTELDRYLDVVEADAEALSLASAYETARREAIAAIQKLPEWSVVDAEAERRKEVDRVKAAYPVKENEEIGEYIERVARAEEGSLGASPLRPTRSLEELLEAAKNLPGMTAEERIEQKVSWVFGQNALASPNHLSEGEVAGVVYKKAFEEVLADLRLAVDALHKLHRGAPSVDAGAALECIKTKGL
jgi:hypothetical protein